MIFIASFLTPDLQMQILDSEQVQHYYVAVFDVSSGYDVFSWSKGPFVIDVTFVLGAL